MKLIRKSILLNFTVALLAIAAGACGGSKSQPSQTVANRPSPQEPMETDVQPQDPMNQPSPQAPMNQPLPEQPTGQPSPQEPMDTPQPQAPTLPPTSATMPMDDAQIAAVTNAASTGEVQQAELAQAKATRTDVRQFAQMMNQEHRKALQEQTQLLTRLQIAPQSNPVATEISKESQENVETLRDLKGKEFDKQYIDDQVKTHAKVLDLLDNQLIPNAKNPELKANLQQMRPKIANHLRKAQTIQQKIEASEEKGGKKRER